MVTMPSRPSSAARSPPTPQREVIGCWSEDVLFPGADIGRTIQTVRRGFNGKERGWLVRELGRPRPAFRWAHSSFANCAQSFIFVPMSSVQEIEAVLPKLSRAEIEEVRAWIDDFLEDQLELTDEVKAKLDQSRREIAEGHYTTRRPE